MSTILIIHQNIQNLTADSNWVNKWWFGQQKSIKGPQSVNTMSTKGLCNLIHVNKSQQKVNILIIHQNVQNLTADPNLVNKWWFGQQKVNAFIIHQNVQNLTADSNLVEKGLVTLKKGLFYRSNWRVGGLFYLTFSLNASKTII